MGRPSDGLRTLLVRITVLIGLALAVLLPAGLWLERVLSSRLTESRVADLRTSLVRGVAATAARIRLAETRLGRLALLLGTAAERVDQRDAADFDRATRRAPDGTTRLAGPMNAATDAVLWVPSDYRLDRFQRGLLRRGLTIVSQLGAGTIGETADDVWFITPAGAEVMYIPNDPAYSDRPSPPGYDVSTWVDPVRPENNPSGHSKWLPAQRSPRPPLWYATIVMPVFRNGMLLGVAGLDFSIGGLFSQFGPSPAGPGTAHLIVEPNGLIAYGDGAEFDRTRTDSLTIGGLPNPLRDSLRALIDRARQSEPRAVVSSSIGNKVMLAARLERPSWTVITLIERAAVVAPLREPLRMMRLGLISVLSLLLVSTLGAVATDVRRRRSIDDVKARAGERFNRLFQMLPVAVALTRADTGELVEANEAAARLAGLTREQLMGATELAVWNDPKERNEIRRTIEEHGFVADYATTFANAAGDRIEVLMAARVIEVDHERYMLTVIQDLSAQRQLEAQLIQSQKLEAVGRLAGGVAHDFNNLLTAVTGYGELLAASLPASDGRQEDIGEILNAARRGATLTRQLLGFARQQSAAPRVVDMNEVISGLKRMLELLIGEAVTIAAEFGPAIGTVVIDPGQLEQVVTNLAMNARDAMPAGGTLTIRTRDDGRHVVLEVTDTGSGMPDEVKAHIFEPFYTTKDMGKGTGLGLATCYGIVRQAGGTIRCDSALGRGTTFQVVLPRHGERLDRPTQESNTNPVMTKDGTYRIMVVDDDEMVRGITAAILEDGGYQVVAWDGASSAMAHLREAHEPVDLVVSDIMMPRINGPAFGRALAGTHPSLPILFISGYTPDDAIRRDLSALGHPFLAKPFSREDFLRAVAAGLGGN